MSILIGPYEFHGLFTTTDEIKDSEGVYVILCHRNNEHELMDVGESRQLKTCLQNHELKASWLKNCEGEVQTAVYYTDGLSEQERNQIKQTILTEYQEDTDLCNCIVSD